MFYATLNKTNLPSRYEYIFFYYSIRVGDPIINWNRIRMTGLILPHYCACLKRVPSISKCSGDF